MDTCKGNPGAAREGSLAQSLDSRRGLPTGTCVFVDVERLSASGRMSVGVLSNLAPDAHAVLSLYDAWLADA